MKQLFRTVTIAGAALLAVSFVIPAGSFFFNSPYTHFARWFGIVLPVRKAGESLGNFGVSMAILYPYVFGLLTAITLVMEKRWSEKRLTALQSAWHVFGTVMIATVGALLLASGDDSIPRAAQWAAILAPLAFLTLVFLTRGLAAAGRRLPLVSAVGFLPHMPIQFLIAKHMVRSGYPSWGFVLGGAGALAGCIGGIGLSLAVCRAQRKATGGFVQQNMELDRVQATQQEARGPR